MNKIIVIKKMSDRGKNCQIKITSIGFLTLYKKFKSLVIRHFLITTIWTAILSLVLAVIANFIDSSGIENNYSLLLPEKLQSFFPNLSQKKFIGLGLLLVFVYSFTHYFSNLWEGELRIKGGNYVKNLLLDKFRRLTLEEKQARREEIGTLVELDSGEIGYYWEHVPNHVYHSILAIVLILLVKKNNFAQMKAKETIFSFSWLILINIVSYYFTKIVLKNEKVYKRELSKEWSVINKEKEKSILIDSMGLTSQHRIKQRNISKKNEDLLLSFSHVKSLSRTVPSYWLAEMFPYLLLMISGVFSVAQKNLLPMWWIFDNAREIFRCFWDYGDYASSCYRINSFLSLPEKNDNLSGLKINQEIKSVVFQNVFFQYVNRPELILKNYSQIFTKEKLNHLSGKNGTGKSTIFYLILGMLKPTQGQVIIETSDGQSYQLHKEVNLKHWREKVVAYATHDNLIEEGSTGQKQSANINWLLINKEKAQIFLSDEADNALDQNKQEEFRQKLEELARQKLVIYIKH